MRIDSDAVIFEKKKNYKNAGRKEDALVEGWPSSKLASKGCSKPLARFIFHNDDDDDDDSDDDDDNSDYEDDVGNSKNDRRSFRGTLRQKKTWLNLI